ncbi:hypothetical protein B0H10DRAFT_2003860 [Mycena sp. CBHHK59/15]|nr:hypothetical protein B0H10DRAFT_2003860 [Mycena sp. CBHHK59/15]
MIHQALYSRPRSGVTSLKVGGESNVPLDVHGQSRINVCVAGVPEIVSSSWGQGPPFMSLKINVRVDVRYGIAIWSCETTLVRLSALFISVLRLPSRTKILMYGHRKAGGNEHRRPG